MGKIAKKFRYDGERTLMQSGNSVVVSINPTNLEVAGTEIGKQVKTYFDGKSQVLIELKLDKDVK